MTTYYEKIEIVGVSEKSYEDAIQTAVKGAKDKYKEVRWFEVIEFRGGISDSGNVQFQAVVKVAVVN